ncbi:hypothetical protein [Streptomyces indicus]|uniref:Uncharacterized protein n=1 Tax=Streptomyces indicus TaxID=417292 RepID=A0A1G9HBS5_9ACTN|nr:hypothetical protein [Streptomyces indicus]SDL10312.1 hypothetical protein SAMN05421806_118103 [Streptomyces indicus]
MSDQHSQEHGGSGPYDPYRQQQPEPQWPTGAGGQDDGPHTQRWQGRTWETQSHPHTPAAAADTAYLPPQHAAESPQQSYGGPQPGHAAPQQTYGGPLPPEAPATPDPYTGQDPYGHQQAYAAQQPYPQQSYGDQQSYADQPSYGDQPSYQAATQEPYPQQSAADPYPHQQSAADPYPHQQSAAAPYPYEERAADAYAYSAAQAAAAAPEAGQAQVHAQAPAEPAPAAAPEGAPAYGPATVVGNTRITDAQRARAEGRSPIIAPGIQPAGITAALGLLLAGGAALGDYALLVPLLALQGLTAAGWFRLNGMWPARQGIALAFAGALTADIVLLAAGREHAPAAIIGTLGVWVLLTLVIQLRSRADADDRMQGLMATVASAALAIIAAGFLGASADAATVGALAVAVATLARALPLPAAGSVVVSLLAAAGAGVAAGAMTGLGSGGALLGFGAGVCALVGLRVASYDYPSRFVHMTAGVALPLAAAAPAVYLLGRVIG